MTCGRIAGCSAPYADRGSGTGVHSRPLAEARRPSGCLRKTFVMKIRKVHALAAR
ncbi:hypothetical protein FHS38_003255 [Streptomyces netropsis]|uniref:Uncharacterized protein n=1 Tax=Streptomyces netropsis TaxID=55404 RepID=A0A7W7LCM0_STRNE|nr:hypothetical protein [Streptomyces netropsis]